MNGDASELARAEQQVHQWQLSFSLNSNNMSSDDMRARIEQLNDLLATALTWQAAPGEGADPGYSQRLAELIQRINWLLPIWTQSYSARLAFERSQVQPGLP